MMRAAFATVALPFYAVAIGAQYLVVAYRMVRFESRMQAAAKAAAAQRRDDVRGELARQRMRVAEGARRNWGAN